MQALCLLENSTSADVPLICDFGIYQLKLEVALLKQAEDVQQQTWTQHASVENPHKMVSSCYTHLPRLCLHAYLNYMPSKDYYITFTIESMYFLSSLKDFTKGHNRMYV